MSEFSGIKNNYFVTMEFVQNLNDPFMISQHNIMRDYIMRNNACISAFNRKELDLFYSLDEILSLNTKIKTLENELES